MIAGIALHLWQSTLFAIVAWALTLACRRNAANVRYWIWFVASVKFLVPFAWLQWLGDRIGRALPEPLPVDPGLIPGLIEAGSAIFVPDVVSSSGSHSQPGSALTMIGATIWALGVAFLLIRWLVQLRAVQLTAAEATPIEMDLPVPVRITSDARALGVFGMFKPLVLLPRAALSELRAEQLHAVLEHEMCHVRRQDNLTAAVHRCVEIIFWLHPLVWWLGAQLLREREVACDETVVEDGHDPALYAESILSVCRLGVAAELPGVAASTGGSLKERLTSIMSSRRAVPIDHLRFMLLLLVAMLATYGPVAAGVVSGASREAASAGPIVFDAIALRPSDPNRQRGALFDADARQLTLDNVSLRQLIRLAYPASLVNAESELIDRTRYDIEARWRDPAVTSERNVYRELLKKVLMNNSNLEMHVSKR